MTAGDDEPAAQTSTALRLRWQAYPATVRHLELVATGAVLCGGRNYHGLTLSTEPLAPAEGEAAVDEAPHRRMAIPAYTPAELEGVERALRQRGARGTCLGCCLAVVIAVGMDAALDAIERVPGTPP